MPQPLNIPILYTGKNIATPDWKTFTRDINARFAQVSQQKQQQKQFDALQNERQRKEFLRSVDVDALNSTNETLLAQKYELTKGVEDWMTKRLTEKQGEITDQDILEARMISNRANQEINRLNNWQKNQQLDQRAALQNIEWYDQEKLKEIITNWDGKTPYDSSKLELALRDMDISEVIEPARASIKNPNELSITSEIAGNKVTDQESFNSAYSEIVEENGVKKIVPKNKEQINYIKAETAKGKDAFLKQRAIDKNFSALSQEQQQDYGNKAVNAGAKREDGKYLWLRDVGGLFAPEQDLDIKEISDKENGGRAKLIQLDLRKTTKGNFSEAPVKLEGTHTIIREDGRVQKVTVKPNRLKATSIAFEENPATGQKEWMVSGTYVRPLTEEEGFDPDREFFERTIAEPVKIPYVDVKENIGRKFNVLLPVETKKKKAY